MADDFDKLPDDMDDLESQLAALGMLDGDGDDGGLSALLGGGDDDDPFAMFEALGEGGSTASTPVAMDGDVDLEDQLAALLAADQSADEEFEIRDISASAPTQTVYDPEVEGMGVLQYVKGTFKAEESTSKGKLFEDVSVWKMLATAGIGVLFILVGAASVIFAVLAIRDQEEAIAAVSHFTPLELPTGTANNANFAFINQPMDMGARRFTLSRISAGATGTFFFFDEHFSPDDYIIFLYNQARHLYPLSTFDINAAPGSGTVLQFGSLSRNTLFLTLHIQCRTSHEYVRFEYRFLSPPAHAPVLYLARGVQVNGDFPGLMIRHAVFDNTSSQIHYSFTHDPRTAGIRMNPNFGENFVSLNDLFSTINNLTNGMSAVYYEDFDITIGKATFGALLSIDGLMHVNFNNLTFFYPSPSFDVTPRDLLDNNQAEPFPVQVGSYTLNLEAMQQQGSLLVLTLHGLDENGLRRETIPDMTIRINAGTRVIFIPGETRSQRRGSDVLFDLAPYLSYIREIPISQYHLLIHSVEFDLPQISIPLQMCPVFNDLPNARRFAAETAVTESFLSLLAYKSGDASIGGIIGVSDAARDAFLTKLPVESVSYRPMYNATVVTGDLVSNYDYLSVVEVQWVSGTGSAIEYFHGIFQVTSRSQDGIWSVVDIRQI